MPLALSFAVCSDVQFIAWGLGSPDFLYFDVAKFPILRRYRATGRIVAPPPGQPGEDDDQVIVGAPSGGQVWKLEYDPNSLDFVRQIINERPQLSHVIPVAIACLFIKVSI
jgi:hypothetical protein